jgi:hypothetical protein
VAASIQIGTNVVANQIKSLNALQYKELMDELRPGAIPDGIRDQTDWFSEVYGTGLTQNYQLQVSDGNEKFRYFVSGGYLDEKGVLNSAFFRRFNMRANVDSQIRKWLHFGLNVSYSDNAKNGVTTGQGSNRGGVVLAVVNLPQRRRSGMKTDYITVCSSGKILPTHLRLLKTERTIRIPKTV